MENDYRHILIAVNGSLGPLKEGLKIASEENCWATVVKLTPSYDGDLDLTGVRNISDVINAESEKAVKEIRDAIREQGGNALVRVESGKNMSETINRVASENRCDLIVMGAKKKGGFINRLLDRNLIKKVRSAAKCPVKVVAD